jgi:HlyD family type I secretion membrane fusion protein
MKILGMLGRGKNRSLTAAEQPAFAKPLKSGYRVVFIMLGTFVAWSVAWPLAEGTYVQGELAYTAKQIDLNHPEGGQVTEIRVSLGDYVTKDQPLITFDTADTEAELQVLNDRLARLVAERRRRLAEASRQNSIDWTAETPVTIPRSVMEQEQTRFEERRLDLTQQQNIQESRTRQLEDSVAGLERQLDAIKETQSSVQEELSDLASLLADGMVSEKEVLALRRQNSQLEREKASLQSQLASERERIQEISYNLARSEGEYKQRAIDRLAELDSRIEELTTRKREYQRLIGNGVLRAPADGWVDDISVAVEGETVRAGENVIEFVPDAGQFMVSARLSPTDVDSVEVGQRATLEFSTFSRRNPPRIDGELEQISAGTLEDPNSGQAYYRVRVRILPDQPAFNEIRDMVRVGMPVQTLIQSGERTFARYIIDPFLDLTRGAFHE